MNGAETSFKNKPASWISWRICGSRGRVLQFRPRGHLEKTLCLKPFAAVALGAVDDEPGSDPHSGGIALGALGCWAYGVQALPDWISLGLGFRFRFQVFRFGGLVLNCIRQLSDAMMR